MSDYIQVPAYDLIPESNREALDRALRVFQGPLELGCTLAGGFVRALYRGDSLPDYFAQTKDGLPGDIDVFLPPGLKPSDVHDEFPTPKGKLERSHAGFGWNFVLYPRRTSIIDEHSIRVQLIDYPEFCSKDPVSVVDRFDFTNVTIAISVVSGTPILTVHRDWKGLEDSRTLGIRNVTSPFLGKRIVKYLRRKGLVGVSSDSAPRITEWLARCAKDGNFVLDGRSFDILAKEGVMSLFANGFAPKEDIIMFLGRWEVVVSDRKMGDYTGFHSNESVDWALNQMQGSNP